MRRHALSDAQWERIADMLPPNGRRGRPWKDHRRVIDAFFGFSTPAPLGAIFPSTSVAGRPSMSASASGAALVSETTSSSTFWPKPMPPAAVPGSCSLLTARSSGPTRRPLAREKNARMGEPADHALGRSRGGFSTKIHLVCDAKGRPIGAEVSPGQEHETAHFASLIDSISIRGARGRPRKRPDAMAGDKGYSAGWTRSFLRDRRIEPIIPTRKNEALDPAFDRERYRERNFVERCIGWLKEARRIATRYEKLAVHYLGMLTLGMIMQYL